MKLVGNVHLGGPGPAEVSRRSRPCREMRPLTNASRATAGLSAAALILAGSSSSSSSNSSTLSWADSFSSHMVLQQLPSPTVL
eukprot:COSAG01_NODE_22816_length_840_cov_0.978408_2_plen_82_part_01